jgi:hypothetical protein
LSGAQGGGGGGGGGGGAGGFLATVRNAATDMLGISSTASPSTAGAETVPDGVNDSNNNNNNNDSNGDIASEETVSGGGGGGNDDAKRQGNATGDGRFIFFLCSAVHRNGAVCVWTDYGVTFFFFLQCVPMFISRTRESL